MQPIFNDYIGERGPSGKSQKDWILKAFKQRVTEVEAVRKAQAAGGGP
jgi:hypothetical protein